MRHAYKTINFRDSTLAVIEQSNDIIEEYEADGLILTLRQLFYQFIGRDVFPDSWIDPVYNKKKGLDPDTKNTVKNYKRLAAIINDARFGGLISWTSIEDRTRNLRSLAHWESPAEIVETAAAQFRVDKWVGQEWRVEVWIEKDALIGIVERTCQRLDVPCFACRGYVSSSELWAASQRLLEWEKEGYKTVVIHLGDHDPSGVDMTRDIADKLKLFDAGTWVKRVALTMKQINSLKPPPNPAKLSDSRAKQYIVRFGYDSWELDALDPKYLDRLITREIKDFRDDLRFDEEMVKEKKAKSLLTAAVKKLLKEFKK